MDRHLFNSLTQLHNDNVWDKLENHAHHNWTLPDGRKTLPVDLTKIL